MTAWSARENRKKTNIATKTAFLLANRLGGGENGVCESAVIYYEGGNIVAIK